MSEDNKMSWNNPLGLPPPKEGNPFGWKLSFISLGVIVFLILVACYLHYVKGMPIERMVPEATKTTAQDTLNPKG